ncbi:type II CAAX endopeptidase family protein [Gorillibacterium massiliense]|uniref:type II CAAX endopeptidase family protein n=1 Tax=Gorillibacterium massiliense TaxID=1280390 RepID=UPI0005943390|nr:type II CAAX endopeptidase family protein [Gorillibacterium massiliense]
MNKKKLWIFVGMSYGITWLLWLPLLLNRQWDADLPVLKYQFYLGSFGPLLGAAIASFMVAGRTGVRQWAARAYSFRFAPRWLGIVAAMAAVYGIVGITAHRLITGAWPIWSQFGLTDKLPGLNVWGTMLVLILTFGFGEESGWRGFLLPELHKRFSLMNSALIVAGIWMLWHLPAFWFNETYMHMGPGVFGWAISLAYGSVLLAWLCQGSRFSIVPVILWHGGFDLLTGSDQSDQAMAMVCSMLVIIHGVLLSRKMARMKA